MNKPIVDEGRQHYTYNATDHSAGGGTHVRVNITYSPVNDQWEWSIIDFSRRPRIVDMGVGTDPIVCQQEAEKSLAPYDPTA